MPILLAGDAGGFRRLDILVPTHHRSLQRLHSTADKTKNRNVYRGELEEETQSMADAILPGGAKPLIRPSGHLLP